MPPFALVESQEKSYASLWAYFCVCDLQHSMGFEVVCRDTVLPLGWLMCTRNTNLTRVFLRPMSVSPLRSSMSELRSFRIPAQSILEERQGRAELNTTFQRWHYNTNKLTERWIFNPLARPNVGTVCFCKPGIMLERYCFLLWQCCA